VTRDQRLLLVLLVSFALLFLWSAIRPHDYFTWFLEVVPAVLGLAILTFTYRRFRFTTLLYVLMWIHAVILVVGGHYTYAEVPLFNWLRDAWGLSRNHYDRVGHFAQGFVPSMIAREILVRLSPVRHGGWLIFFVICIALALSAVYELFEWAVARATGTAAEAFLGTQGDPWDTQADMALALLGATTALLTLSRLHDRHLRALPQQ
jgi:putative membrane protein